MLRLARFLIILPILVAAYIGKFAPIPDLSIVIPVPEIVVSPAFTKEEVKCAADMVFGEARGEPFQGQVAVAAVAIRRSLSVKYPYDLCKVVTEPNQFYGYTKRKRAAPRAVKSVKYAIAHLGEIQPAMYFHRKEIADNYATHYIVGNHVFFTKHKRY